jgi:hypothetical protein
LASHLQHPKAIVQIGAIRGLGSLRDPSAAVILRAFASEEDGDRVGGAATEALKTLDEKAPFAPPEVRELRELVRTMQEDLDKLQEKMDSLESKQESMSERPSNDAETKSESKVAQVNDE